MGSDANATARGLRAGTAFVAGRYRGRVLFLRRGRGSARVPEPLRSTVAGEGTVFWEEDLRGSVTYRNYRAPGEYSNWRREPTTGAIVVTTRRLLVWITNGGYVNMPLVDGRPLDVAVRLDPRDRIAFTYDAGKHRTDRSGEVQIRLSTPSAAHVGRILGAPEA